MSLLIYTDDLIFLADLQCLLDELSTWCNIWGAKINEPISRVIHFKNRNVHQTSKIVRCGNKYIDIYSEYKLLGLIVDELLDYDVIAEHVTKNTH